MGDTARYLYAVTRGLAPADLDGVTGFHDRPVELVDHQGLTAVVSTVDLEEYGEDALTRNLEDLGWLERTVRVHDGVVHAVATRAPTAPMRLATICFDDARVRERLREWHFALEQALDRVDGRAEWSVKVLRPARVREAAGAKPTSGADYLRRKKEQAEERATGDAAAFEVAREIHADLQARSAASRQLAPQDPRLTGHEGTMVLNAAYLVAVDAADEFEARVGDLAADHPEVVVDVRGPWPPYSFAMLEQR
jgi:hypothetical protein